MCRQGAHTEAALVAACESRRQQFTRNIDQDSLDTAIVIAGVQIKRPSFRLELRGSRKGERHVGNFGIEKWNPDFERMNHRASIEVASAIKLSILDAVSDADSIGVVRPDK